MKQMGYSISRPNPEFFALLDNHEANRHDNRFIYGNVRQNWDMAVIGTYRLINNGSGYGFQRAQEALIQPGPQQIEYYGNGSGYRSTYLDIVTSTGEGCITGSIDYLEDSHSQVLRTWDHFMAEVDDDIFDTSYTAPDSTSPYDNPYVLSSSSDYTLHEVPNDNYFEGPGYPAFSARGSTAGLLLQTSSGPVSYILAGTYLEQTGQIRDTAQGSVKIYSNPYPSKSLLFCDMLDQCSQRSVRIENSVGAGVVNITSGIGGAVTIEVIDISGRVVTRSTINVSPGEKYVFNILDYSTTLSPGIYFVTAEQNGQMACMRVTLLEYH